MDGERQVNWLLGQVADQVGDLHAQRVGDLAQHQERGVAGAALQLGEVTLGHARGLGQDFARHAAPRAAKAHPVRGE